MDSQLRLHVDNLSMFVEPVFERKTVGYYSISRDNKYVDDYSEKASLVALKELEKTTQGVIEYEVPTYIEELNLDEGYETYNDSYDVPEQAALLQWLKTHPKECADIDLVCSEQAIAKIFRAPYAEATSTPWELRVTRGPDGICYLNEEESGQVKYSELNVWARKQHFKQKAFQTYMSIKKGAGSKHTPPSDSKNSFFRVNKLELDSGIVIYQSEAKCFDINYNTIDLKVQPLGQYDLPSPSVRLQWWSSGHLSGTDTIMCGYYNNDDADDPSSVHRIVSFDIKHMKPRRIRDVDLDDEVCIGSLCTFVQFVKDMTFTDAIDSFILRFEPGSKRVCILDPVMNKTPAATSSFDAQISETDETSSIEITPRTPRPERLDSFDYRPWDSTSKEEAIPRLRKFNRQDSSYPPVNRKNSLTAELGIEMNGKGEERGNLLEKKKELASQQDPDWVHLVIVLSTIAFTFIGIPWLIEWFGHTSPY